MELDLDGLSEHDNSVTLHDGDTTKTLALLEPFDDKRLLRREHNFCNFVGLDVFWMLDLGTTSLLAHLPVDGLDLAC